MYIIRKQKSFRNWFHSKKLSFFKENTDKVMIYQFLIEKSFRLDVFDREFIKISNIKLDLKRIFGALIKYGLMFEIRLWLHNCVSI